MTGCLVDSNILLDILTEDAVWGDWSAQQLAQREQQGRLLINPIIFAEVSLRFATHAEAERVLMQAGLVKEALPWEAAFVAARAFQRYRRQGGLKTAPLPDFFIGAHASVAGYALLTRDKGRYRTYFPGVRVLAPEG